VALGVEVESQPFANPALSGTVIPGATDPSRQGEGDFSYFVKGSEAKRVFEEGEEEAGD